MSSCSCKVRASWPSYDYFLIVIAENRAFDHYFGTMPGVRGFSDPNVKVNSGDTPVWEQAIDPSITDADYLLPWYLNYQGGDFLNATQCM
jgi:phospholipase C